MNDTQGNIKQKYTVQSLTLSEENRIKFIQEHMEQNRAFAALPPKERNIENLLHFKNRYYEYRKNWRELPNGIIANSKENEFCPPLPYSPMCVDIEVAAVCDLACPFCYRQHIATPDKIMDENLYKRIIDECAQMNVPSVKLNWRGEPLMHPQLPEFIAYAKDKGILEVMINTNAVKLNKQKACELIEAGLDGIIYSFDGGSKNTYEQMRPGRFKYNSFDTVYKNIKTLTEVKQSLDRVFPITRIQMIVTKETLGEVDSFRALFSTIVNDVSTKAYSERGGDIVEIDTSIIQKITDHFKNKHGQTIEVKPELILLTGDNQILYAIDRLPCQQIFQRLMITYNGRVLMCCYDWGCQQPIGYLTDDSLSGESKDLKALKRQIDLKKQGYTIFKNLEFPTQIKSKNNCTQSLSEIWNNEIITSIRTKHIQGEIETIPICKNCYFKDTYAWEVIE